MKLRALLLVLGLLLACGAAVWFALDAAVTPASHEGPSEPVVDEDPRQSRGGVRPVAEDVDPAEPVAPVTTEVSVVVTDRGTRGLLKQTDVEVTIEYLNADAGRRTDTFQRTTGDDGRVSLAVERGVSSITVRHENRSARWVAYPGAPPPASLVADVAPHVVVRVENAAGSGVGGVRVVLDWETPGAHPPRTTVAESVSRADGEALLIVPAVSRGLFGRGTAHVALGIPLARSVTRPIDLGALEDAPQNSPVTLVLPDVGSVVVAVLGPDGEAFEGTAAHANLTVINERSVAFGLPHWLSAPVLDGRVVFPYVGVGLRVEVRAYAGKQSLLGGVGRLDGPAQDGQVVRTRVHAGRPKPVFFGRLLDARRQPIARGNLHGKVLAKERSALEVHSGFPSAWVQADADGKFRLVFDTDTPYETAFVLEIWGVAKRFPFQQPIGPEPVDLGDIVLAEVPLLVAGRVVWPDDSQPQRIPLYIQRLSESGGWTGVRHLMGYAEEDGRFEVRGTAPAGELRVRHDGNVFLHPEPAAFTRGQRDVVVNLVRSGGLRGSVTMPPGAKHVPVRVFAEGEIANTGDKWSPGRVGGMVVREDGRFGLQGLHPGKGRVVVYVGGGAEPVEVVENVEVRPGEITEDGRLLLIDIRGHLLTRTITVASAEGDTLTDATVWTRPANTPVGGPGGWYWSEQRLDANGRVTVTVGTSPLHVLASARGHGFAEVLEMRDDTTVKLPVATPGRVRVRLADDVATPEPPLRYSVKLNWAGTRERILEWLDGGADPRSRGLRDRNFGPDRSAVFDVPTPGRYRAHLMLWHDGTNGGAGFPVRAADPLGVIVDGGEEPVELIFRPDPASRAEAFEKHENRE